jgi:uncharacterized membrane protein YkgB
MLVISADWQFDQCRREIVSNFSPIQSWMYHQDLDSGEQKEQETDRHDPVRTFHPAFMKTNRLGNIVGHY